MPDFVDCSAFPSGKAVDIHVFAPVVSCIQKRASFVFGYSFFLLSPRLLNCLFFFIFSYSNDIWGISVLNGVV